MIDFKLQKYALFALLAAALFGASTPLAKLLLQWVSPVTLAGLLYLGSGIGLFVIRIGRAWFGSGETGGEARLEVPDYAWLASAVLAGGVVAPVMLMWGLTGTTASAASLLLNFESVITTLLAAVAFREAVSGRVWVASLVMLAGGLMLSYDPSMQFNFSLNSIAVIGACCMWALDNNLTRRISASDPTTIAMIKGLTAGAVNIVLGQLAGDTVPGISDLLGAMSLGFLSYGISLVLFIYALRHLGSARTGAHFSTAPFIGAAVAIVVVGEPLTVTFAIALVLMVVATWLMLNEQHQHPHTHEYMVHAHRHYHDEHHQHEHARDEGPEPHTHTHVHLPMTHAHPHMPDIHHRHKH